MKEFYEVGSHKWGKSVGSNAQNAWNECWDISNHSHFEARMYCDGLTKWGSKFKKQGGIQIKEEWIGADRLEEDVLEN